MTSSHANPSRRPSNASTPPSFTRLDAAPKEPPATSASAGSPRESLAHQRLPEPPQRGEFMVANSGAMKQLMRQVERIAQNDLTTLLTGESGTGKTTIARLIHSTGPRAVHPFIVVNCASLPRELIEAELFGHAKGAFTGAVADRAGRVEAANGGTLLLDEIGDLPLELQPKLLTFLQDQTFQRIGNNQLRRADVRVIAATNQDLVQLCGERNFREDLYFRLNVLSLDVPPLRERRDAIPGLVEQILTRIAKRNGELAPSVDGEAMHALMDYQWPGNIRQLENMLERACVFREGDCIRTRDLAFHQFQGPQEGPPLPISRGFTFAGKTLSEIEKVALTETLEACRGNKAKAARQLGISERSVYNKIKRHGLTY